MIVKQDDLTGLWNRETAICFLENEIRKRREIGVVLADVDFFVNIDSKVGKQEGDLILQRMAEYLSSYDEFLVSRYEGDEFLLYFFDQEKNEVLGFLENLRKKFRGQRFIGPDSIYRKTPITISLGCCFCMGKNEDSLVRSHLKIAEIALAMAKKMGRNRVVSLADYDMRIILDPKAEISSVVGANLKGFSGDEDGKTPVLIHEPYGTALGPEDEIIFADRGNHRIRKIESLGKTVTLAGTGEYGYSGDGGPAVKAALNKPSGVAVDSGGQIYIADTGNHCIRKVDPLGVITTWAGNGNDGYEGDGGRAVNARLSRPGGVAVDRAGNVYTNDYGNNVIRMITASGMIKTVAGNGEFGYSGDGEDPLKASFNKPYGLDVTPDGRYLYIADYSNHCIREADLRNNIIRTMIGTGNPGYSGDGGSSRTAALDSPFWVSVWGDHYILIADTGNHCIRAVNRLTGKVMTLAGNGKPGYRDGEKLDRRISFNIPAGMTADAKNKLLYVTDYANNAIRRLRLKNLLS